LTTMLRATAGCSSAISPPAAFARMIFIIRLRATQSPSVTFRTWCVVTKKLPSVREHARSLVHAALLPRVQVPSR
jgi:hypothetical protein